MYCSSVILVNGLSLEITIVFDAIHLRLTKFGWSERAEEWKK